MENTDTYMSGLASFVSTIDNQFRRRVCLDCGWSNAKFYHRIKPGQVITSAERLAIQNIIKSIAKDLITHANKQS